MGVVGGLSISEFVGVASVGNGFLLSLLVLADLVTRGQIYRRPFTRVFFRLPGEFKAPEPGSCTRLQNIGQKKNQGE